MRRYTQYPICLTLIVAFVLTALAPVPAQAEVLLPTPGTMVHLSPAFNPPVLKGIKVHTDNPFEEPSDTIKSN